MRQNPNRELAKRQVRRLKVKERRGKPPRQISDFALLGRWLLAVSSIVLSGLVAAAYFTPMLAISSVQVLGANRVEVEEIETRLKPILGSSLTQVSEQQVADLLAEFQLIDTISLESRPPHTLIVRVQEREPLVAVKVGGDYFLYDAAGVKIGPEGAEREFPRLIGIGNPKTSAKFESAVAILLELPQRLYKRVQSLELVGDAGMVRLRDFDADIAWGTKADAVLKTQVLESILDSLEKLPELVDVSSPLAPVVKY